MKICLLLVWVVSISSTTLGKLYIFETGVNIRLPLVKVSITIALCTYTAAEKEYPPYDGWYNNRAHPEWGAVGLR